MSKAELIEAIAELDERIEEMDFMGWHQESEAMKRKAFEYTAKLFELDLRESGDL